MKRYIRTTEYIEAMATVGRHFKPNFIIVVTPDTNRQGVCYFKYLDSESYDTAEHIARIDIRSADRIYHKDGTGKKEWNLSSKDKKALCKYLDSSSKENRKVTNWKLLLYHWNNEHGLLEEDYSDDYDSRLDAFADGFFDELNEGDPAYVASDLIRPDYMQLEN